MYSYLYDFLCEETLDVKWDKLICKNLRLHARKIRANQGNRFYIVSLIRKKIAEIRRPILNI
jgi:hypothetical protein